MKNEHVYGTPLVVQWLRFCTSAAGGMGSLSGWETKSHKLHGVTGKIKKKKERKKETAWKNKPKKKAHNWDD